MQDQVCFAMSKFALIICRSAESFCQRLYQMAATGHATHACSNYSAVFDARGLCRDANTNLKQNERSILLSTAFNASCLENIV